MPTVPKFHLPFGNTDAVVSDSFRSVRDSIELAVPGDFDLDQLGNSRSFHHATNRICIGHLNIQALGLAPMRVHRKSATKRTLVIPFSGHLNAVIGRQSYVAQAGRTALFSSGQPRVGVMSNHFSQLLIEIDDAHLVLVAQSLLGHGSLCTPPLLDLDQDRELPLLVNGISFDAVFRHLCRTVDSLSSQPKALSMLGLDDVFYRSFVNLLAPKLCGEAANKLDNRAKDTHALDLVCEYIQSRIEHTITLTQLQQVSGLSERGLQYAFQRRFKCSPMAWVRHERLTVARALLCSPAPNITVTRVALEVGFCNMSLFARQYHQRFGELPSATRLRAVGRGVS
ncbi:MAG: AraC family transcriptional regulator [Methylotenera sp.]|nr:AraC family transcriptional regulator [Methylotenera sp.]